MLFTSYKFIFLFLPITFALYYFISSSTRFEKHYPHLIFLSLASLFFYAQWKKNYLWILLALMAFNYVIIYFYKTVSKKHKPLVIVLGISVILLTLGYYKYTNFLLNILNDTFDFDFAAKKIAMPLAISFFSFQQIAFLVDYKRGIVKEPVEFTPYAIFMLFFPPLIAGPILRYNEIIEPFKSKNIKKINYDNIALGLFLFSIGLFKKSCIADWLAITADAGYSNITTLSLFESWTVTLSYTFQLYFDFSGYSDMAIGLAYLFNIKLPENFNSPYKSRNLVDFWRRWHITLCSWLKDYIYIPLGGSRFTYLITCRNLLITFGLSGLWHGAYYSFILWGLVHAFGMIGVLTYRKFFSNPMPGFFAKLSTFLFVHLAWILFRSPTVSDALAMLKNMFSIDKANLAISSIITPLNITGLCAVTIIAFLAPNSNELKQRLASFTLYSQKNSLATNVYTFGIAFYIFILLIVSLIGLQFTQTTPFLYFNF